MDGPGDPGGRPRVLLIEDDPLAAALLGQVLAEEGYVVASVRDGPAALVAAAAQPPDLIVLEPWPPRSGARAFAAAYARRARPRAPLLLLSAAPWAELAGAASAVEAAGALTKPCDLDAFVAAAAALTRAAPVPAKDDHDELARRRYLRRLAGELVLLRSDLTDAGAAATALEKRAWAGDLGLAGAAKLRALRRTTEQLRLRLGHYTREYEVIRAGPRQRVR